MSGDFTLLHPSEPAYLALLFEEMRPAKCEISLRVELKTPIVMRLSTDFETIKD